MPGVQAPGEVWFNRRRDSLPYRAVVVAPQQASHTARVTGTDHPQELADQAGS